MKKEKISKNSLINRWANDKKPIRISGKPSKERIEIKYVNDINDVLNEREFQSNEQKN